MISPESNRYKTLTPNLLALLIANIAVSIPIFYFLGKALNSNNLNFYLYFISIILITFVLIGGYQLLYWIQNNNTGYIIRKTNTKFDNYIPFKPQWIWVYAVGYYYFIGSIVLAINSLEQLAMILVHGLYILFMHVMIFLFFPVTMPLSFRDYKNNGISTSLLKIVQKFDNGQSCFPSLHCAIATYVAFIVKPVFGDLGFLMVAAVVLSCLFTKQHSIVDIPIGIAFGWVGFFLLTL